MPKPFIPHWVPLVPERLENLQKPKPRKTVDPRRIIAAATAQDGREKFAVDPKEQLGIEAIGMRSDGDPTAVFYPGSNSVVHFDDDRHFNRFDHDFTNEDGEDNQIEMSGMFKMFFYGGDYQLLILNRLAIYENWINQIKATQSHTTPQHTAWLDHLLTYGKSSENGKAYIKHLFLTGRYGSIHPTEGNHRGSMGGRVLRLQDSDTALNQIHMGYPIALPSLQIPTPPNGYNAVDRARLPKTSERWDYLTWHKTRACGYWQGTLTSDDDLKVLLSQQRPLDICLRFKRTNNFMYVWCALRLWVDRADPYTEFADFQEVLDGLSKPWTQQENPEVMKHTNTFFSVGGTFIPDKWPYEAIDNPDAALQSISDTLSTIGNSKGKWLVGIKDGLPFFVDEKDNPADLYEGSSKRSGKTLEVLTRVGALDPEKTASVWIPVTSAEQDAPIYFYTNVLGARVVEFDCPDALDLIMEEKPDAEPTPDEVLAKQKELHRGDNPMVKEKAQEIMSYLLLGHVILKSNHGDTVRWLNTLTLLIWHLKKLQQARVQADANTKRIMFIFDNLSHLADVADDDDLGEYPITIAVRLMKRYSWLLNNIANLLGNVIGIAQERTQLEAMKTGVIKQHSHIVKMGERDEHITVDLETGKGVPIQNRIVIDKTGHDELLQPIIRRDEVATLSN